MPKRDDEDALSIRFPKPLAAELRALARAEHRSVNGTVLEAVERYLRSRRRPSGGPPQQRRQVAQGAGQGNRHISRG